jgi:glycosyltransferase involved in cell wall biosynthesis
MRIGIFVACAGRRDGGPETYELGLVRALAAVDHRNEYRIFCLARQAAEAFHLAQDNVRFHVLWPPARRISVPLSLPLSLFGAGVDLLHATVYPPPFCPVDLIFTMHDASPFAHPEFFPPAIRRRLSFLVHRGLKKAKLIVCASTHARDATVERFKLPPERFLIIPHGIDERFHPGRAEEARAVVRERYKLVPPYALYVGKLIERKNLVRLLEAYDQVHADAPELTLALCGRRFWDGRFFDEAVARVRGTVVELGHVPDEDLPLLYIGAEMLVYPTLYEGFGFPVLEAMACGTPVITSNVSSLPEIAGGAALLVDPYAVDDIAHAMRRLHADADLRASLRQKGLVHAAEFTWRAAAEGTLEAYRRVDAL